MHPQKIDLFADYYGSLYNLKDDPSTPQPSEVDIDSFLLTVDLPKLSTAQLEALNALICKKEIP